MLHAKINILSICTFTDWLVFLLSIAITIIAIFIGNKLKSNDKNNKNINNYKLVEYLVMGRQLTLPLFIATLVSSWYGGILGVAQISFEHGVYNFVTQGIFWYFSYLLFAIFLAKKINKAQALTLAELIAKNFGKKSATLAAIIIFFKTLPISMAISVGIFLQLFLPINLTTGIILGVSFVACYTYFGGLRAIVFSDAIQFLFMLIGVASVLIFSITNFGGISYLTANLPQNYFKLTGNYSYNQTFIWFFIAIATTFVNPTFYQRCFAANSPKTAKKGIFISIFIWFIFDLCTTLGGMYAKATIPNANPSEGYLVYALQILPIGFKGLLLASILATILSTLDSFLFLTSNIIFYDLKLIRTKSFNLKHLIAIIISAAITIYLSSFFDGKIELVWKTFKGYFTACLIMPLAMGYLIKSNFINKLPKYLYNNDMDFVKNSLNNKIDDLLFISSLASLFIVTTWDLFKINKFIHIESFYIGNLAGFIMILLLSFKLNRQFLNFNRNTKFGGDKCSARN